MNKKAIILIADDDDDDRFLIQSALDDYGLSNPIAFVNDGLALLDYLRQNNDATVGLILLDLNMPRMNGREVLKILKSEVIVLSYQRAVILRQIFKHLLMIQNHHNLF